MIKLPEVSSNFLGRISKVKCPKRRPLLPLFECIANSVDSFEMFHMGDAINVDIIRKENRGELTDDKVNKITGFKITDNE